MNASPRSGIFTAVEPALVEQAFIDGGLDIGKLRQLSGQVKIVRDKVFVHMDKEANLRP